jgi:hypothetical protein
MNEETPEGGSSISLHRKVTSHEYKSKAVEQASKFILVDVN